MGNEAWKRWFWRPRPLEEPSMRVVVFPGAGGNASQFRHWLEWLPSDVELFVVQYPARGVRSGDPLAKSLFALTENIADAWVSFIGQSTQSPVVLFGHSMGALVAYECVDFLRRHGEAVAPDQLMVSARAAPHAVPGLGAIVAAAKEVSDTLHSVHALPESAFKAVIRQLGGSPEAVLEHAELWRLVEPMLRSDIRLIEQWTFRPRSPLTIPVVAWWGTEDRWVSRSDVEAWQEHSSAVFKCLGVNGGHFFVTNELQTDFKNQLISEFNELAERLDFAQRTQLFDDVAQASAT